MRKKKKPKLLLIEGLEEDKKIVLALDNLCDINKGLKKTIEDNTRNIENLRNILKNL
jgi:hypothetical protein